jgi:hypothetical protein
MAMWDYRTAGVRGFGNSREGTCGVAGYLVEGKQKKFLGSPLVRKPEDLPKPQLICLSRRLPYLRGYLRPINLSKIIFLRSTLLKINSM